MFKTNYSGHNKILGHIKKVGVALPRMTPLATGLVVTIISNLFVNLGMVTGMVSSSYTRFDKGPRS